MRIVMLGDIVGKAGCDGLIAALPTLRDSYTPDLIIANGENAAGGFGITVAIARKLLMAGVHVITLGNHTWHREEIIPYLDQEPRLLRPANYPAPAPGRGYGVFAAQDGTQVGVGSLMGRVRMDPVDDPFRMARQILDSWAGQGIKVTFFDFHAEVTSEKQAFGYYLDGRVSVVVGTHTHVQTADEKLLPGGTAYITDVGMTGPQLSVIGMAPENVINRFVTQRPHRFETAGGLAMVNGIVAEVDSVTGRASSIQRIRLENIG
ncbi:MAG TPA: TIGR00282 family metallophosphoesterase [Capsulimonadaceae bacterium]|nr:TIGR00282 family metallophosphoesterase [Capsulimonadaceae bacterium]